MRFHIGFSRYIKPKKILYWLGLAFFGLLAWLGFSKLDVFADENNNVSSYDIYSYNMIGHYGNVDYRYLTYGSSTYITTQNNITDNCNNQNNYNNNGYCPIMNTNDLSYTRYLTVNNRTWNGGNSCSTSKPLSDQYFLVDENKYLNGVPSLCSSQNYEAMDLIYKVLVNTKFGEQNTNFTSGWLWYIYDDLTPPSTDINYYLGAYIQPIDSNSQNVTYTQDCYFTKDSQDTGNTTNISLPALTSSNEYYVVCPNNLINNGTASQNFDTYRLNIYNKLVDKSNIGDSSKYMISPRWHTNTSTSYCPNLARVEGITNIYSTLYYKCVTDYLPPGDQVVGTSDIDIGGSSGGHCFGDNCASSIINDDSLYTSWINDIDITQGLQDLITLPKRIIEVVTSQSGEQCTPISINFSSITRRFGGFDYSLQLPCMRTTLSNLLNYQIFQGVTIYNLFDLLMGFGLLIVFANRFHGVINNILSGDSMSEYTDI